MTSAAAGRRVTKGCVTMSDHPAHRPRPRSRRVVTGVVAGTALGLTGLLGVTMTASVSGAATPATPAGWKTVWSDDFAGASGSLPSSSNWLFDIGTSYPGGAANWGTGEIAAHTNNPANVSLDGSGNLRITPVRDSAGKWTSARIESQRTDFRPPAGGTLRIEGRLRLPDVSGAAAQGIWPAFWTLGAPFRGVYTNWPSVGEIDIMENVNGGNTVYGTLHCGVAPGGPCNENSGIGGNRADNSPSLQSAFHTYAVEWDRSSSPEQLRWYIDGTQFHSVKSNQVDASTWKQATDHGFFIILNVAVGGGWPGAPTAATASGKPMLVDYVSVMSRGNGTTPPETNPSPANPPVTTPPSGPAPTGSRDAYARIEAESFDSSQGVQVTTADGVKKIGSIGNGDWALFKGVKFGSANANRFVIRAASGAPNGVSGLVEVRLDSRTAAPVGTVSVGSTGGWTSYREVPGGISKATGTHDVYLTFSSGQSTEYVDIDWLRFDRA
ncbi:MAG: hypothetical protein QG622_2950 [Actinomycetota bacterium]|nr:hypothetical protein [Actinomycetota bacterium]